MIDKTDPTNRDTVPAMLTPGEFVLNKEASTMFAPVIEQMNDAGLQHRAMKNMGGGIPTYNTGGLVSQIREHEGFKDYVYDDGKGNPTIGTGHLLPDSYKKYIGKNHKPFSKEELEQMFLADVESAKINASKNFDNWNDLSENVKDGLVNMAFQLGQGGQSKFVKMRKAVEAGDYSEAAAQALDSDWNTQTPTRSTYLANVFLSETPQATIQTSSVAPMTSMPPSMRPNTQVDPIAIEQAIMQASVPQVQAAPPAPTDFGEAFKDARADMGAGGIFNFRGRDYNTNYLEEEDMVTANMGGAIHLQDGGWTSGLLDWFTEPKNGFTGGPPSVILGPTQQQLANQSAEERKSISQAALNPYGDVPAYEGELGTGQQDVIKPSVKDHPRYGEFERNMEASQGTRFLSDPVMAAAIFKNYLELNPLPDVNSDESLLQGSSDSVDTASKLSQEQLANQARDRRMSAVNEVHVPPLNAPPVTQPTQQQLANEAAAKRKVVSQAAINPLADVPAYEGELGTGDQYGPPPPTFTGDVVPYVGGLAGSLANRVGTEVSNAFSSVPTSPRDYNDIAGATGIDVPPKPSNATFEGKSLEELYNMFAVNGGQGTRSDPVLGQALMAEIEAREAAGEVHNVYDTSLHNAAALYRSRTSWPREQIAADISSQNAEKSAAILAVQQAELQAKLDAGTATQLDVDSFERKRKQNETVQKTATRDQETVRLTSEQQAALLAPATDIEAANAKALEAQRTAESERLQSYDPVTGTYSKPKKPENNITGVEAKVDEVQNTTAPTTTVQDGAAKAEAARIAETNKKKKDPEVSGAMDTIKSVFGDLFDSKELIRAAIMYLGGRATGMDGQQALAFAGKNYIAREEAQGIRTQKFIDILGSEGMHEMGSIAGY